MLKPETIKLIKTNSLPKGNALENAKIAGILAGKKTAFLIPYCHPIPIDHIKIEFVFENGCIKVITTVKGEAKTGVEMEGFVATAMALITIYDMCKSIDKEAEITQIRLIEKQGGKGGDFKRKWLVLS